MFWVYLPPLARTLKSKGGRTKYETAITSLYRIS
ncbi:MAG: hypothetical protein RLZ12_556 [Bacillota bacterium]|jgi:hypothetical protein